MVSDDIRIALGKLTHTATYQIQKSKLLTVIIILAIILRFVGLKPGYPLTHPDEPLSYGSAGTMIVSNMLDPERYDYPALTMLLHYTAFKFFFLPLGIAREFISSPAGFTKAYIVERQPFVLLYDKVAGVRSINALYWSRSINAMIGVVTIPFVYILGKRMFDRNVALVAALLTSTNYRHVMGSHIALIDVFNAFITLFTLIIIWQMYEKPNFANALLSGIFIGLTLATKFQFFVAISFILVVIWLFIHRRVHWKALLLYSISTFIMAGVIFAVLNVHLFIHWEQTKYMVGRSAVRYGQGTYKLMFLPYTYLFRLDIGILPSIFFVLGLVWGLLRRFPQSLLLLTVIMPIFFIFTYYSQGGGFLRNFIPAIPLMLIITSFFIVTVAKLIPHKKMRKVVLLLLILFTTAIPLRDSTMLAWGYTKPFTEDQINSFVAQTIPRQSTVITIPPVRFPDVLKLTVLSNEFQPEKHFTVEEAREAGAEYAVIELGGIYNYLYWWSGEPMEMVLPYWDNPGRYLENTLPSLAIMDLARVAEAFVAKPYQALDSPYIFSHLQSVATPSATLSVARFMFDQPDSELIDGWKVAGGEKVPEKDFLFDPVVGKEKKGSIQILSGQKYSEIARIRSAPIIIKPLTHYYLTAWTKADKAVHKEKRDAFFRLDFYPSKEMILSERAGIRVALSSRMFGDGWVKKEIHAVSPSTATFATVSFQVPDFRNGPTYWIDDIELFKVSENINAEYQKVEEIERKIKQDYLFPRSL